MILVEQNINQDFYNIKRNQTMGSKVINYLRSHKIKFNFLSNSQISNKLEVLDAKILFKPNPSYNTGKEYFMVIISKTSTFSVKNLKEKLKISNLSLAKIGDLQSEFNLKSREIPPC